MGGQDLDIIMNVMNAMKMQPIGVFPLVLLRVIQSCNIGESYKDGFFAGVGEILPNGVSSLAVFSATVEIEDMLDDAFREVGHEFVSAPTVRRRRRGPSSAMTEIFIFHDGCIFNRHVCSRKAQTINSFVHDDDDKEANQADNISRDHFVRLNRIKKKFEI